MKNKTVIMIAAVVALLLLLSPACRLYKLEQQLVPEYAEFLSKVQYIISKEERKVFLDLSDAEKPQFIEDFWKRRDPDPYTEVNEFKEEYFERLKAADKLFHGEGKPGILTDRGRIYILFGPPTDRITTPMSRDSYDRCREVWYYGDFPVLFVDMNCNGNYTLASLDLSHLHDLSMAQAAAQKTVIQQHKPFLNFDLNLKKNPKVESRFEGLVVIEIPYRSIWFEAAGDKFKTTFEAELELRDSENTLHWSNKSSYDLILTEAELRGNQNAAYGIEIPFVVERDIAALRQGKNKIQVILRNKTGKEELRKVAEFSL